MVPDDRELAALAEQVAEALGQSQWRLVTAESCTGGWIAKILTDQVGSSGWYEGGAVTYSDALKHDMLGVSRRVLEAHGAVSAEVAAAMAAGALEISGADVAVAVTGIAGPAGGSPDKPVGTVWLAWASTDGQRATQLETFAGDRDGVRRQTVAAALRGVLRLTERG
ncbi:MAG: nicotinamide-nucleotide amidohydrolase family protein [Gammaproteobacteria bacterium]|nr:nicotinamide-nucleotide amidohydrolase family protein [Gammaproteobacteria bacterium]